MKKVCIYCREENPDIKLGIIQDGAEVGQVYVCDTHAEMLRNAKLEIFVDRPATPEEETERKKGMV